MYTSSLYGKLVYFNATRYFWWLVLTPWWFINLETKSSLLESGTTSTFWRMWPNLGRRGGVKLRALMDPKLCMILRVVFKLGSSIFSTMAEEPSISYSKVPRLPGCHDTWPCVKMQGAPFLGPTTAMPTFGNHRHMDHSHSRPVDVTNVNKLSGPLATIILS